MIKDDRRALPEGYELSIAEEGSGNSYIVIIKGEIGRGGSCIVYKGDRQESIGGNIRNRSVVVKEFYPVGLNIKRKRNRKLDISELGVQEVDNYKKLQEHFAKGQSESAEFYDYYKGDQSLPSPFIYGATNNTVYAVSDPGKGRTLSEINFDEKNFDLNRIATIMESICDAIWKIHSKKKLYLDCKPDNFFYYYNNRDLQSKVYLFDFDTIVDIDDIQKGNYQFCSASKGWIPPEQYLIPKTGGYRDPQHIGYHTDIFSVGAVLFWLLTQRKPTEKDLRAIKEGSFNLVSESRFCSGTDIEVIKLIQDLLQNMLQIDTAARQETFRHYLSIKIVRKQFETLYGLTAGNNVHFEPLHAKLKHIESILLDSSEGISDANTKLDDILDSIENRTSVKLDVILDAIDKEAAGTDVKLDDILRAIERHNKTSVKEMLFGSKKSVAITISVFIVIAIAFGAISSLGERAVNKVSPDSSLEIEQQLDDHIILKLANANHQYEVGLENWRRLDYNRAERDIAEAIGAVSEEKSQAEIEVAKINNSLGCLYLDMGKYEESYDYLNSAYVTFRDEYGEQAPETLATLFSIAQYDYYTGDYDSALKTSQEILDKIGSDNNAIITLIKHFQASVYAARGYYDQAISIYEDVLELYKEYLKDDALINELASYTEDDSLDENEKEKYTNTVLWIAKTYENIGEAYIGLGKSEKAKEYIDAGLNMCLENSYIRTKHLSTASLYLKRAIVENQLGEYKEAIDDVDLAVRIEKNIFDFEDNYPGLVEAYDFYGVILESQGKSSEAKEYYENALALAKQSFGENHPQTAEAYYYCGLYSSNEKEYEHAAELIREAIEIRKNILGEKHPNTIKYYLLLAQIESELGNKKEAQDCIDKADSIKFEIGVSDFFGEPQ